MIKAQDLSLLVVGVLHVLSQQSGQRKYAEYLPPMIMINKKS